MQEGTAPRHVASTGGGVRLHGRRGGQAQLWQLLQRGLGAGGQEEAGCRGGGATGQLHLGSQQAAAEAGIRRQGVARWVVPAVLAGGFKHLPAALTEGIVQARDLHVSEAVQRGVKASSLATLACGRCCTRTSSNCRRSSRAFTSALLEGPLSAPSSSFVSGAAMKAVRGRQRSRRAELELHRAIFKRQKGRRGKMWEQKEGAPRSIEDKLVVLAAFFGCSCS